MLFLGDFFPPDYDRRVIIKTYFIGNSFVGIILFLKQNCLETDTPFLVNEKHVLTLVNATNMAALR